MGGVATQGPLTVSQAAAMAKGALEACTVTLVGEVSELSNKPGYKAVYFTVKDEGASLPCMMWSNRFRAANADVRIGSLVQLTGRFTLYAPKGRMNFDVFSLSLAGQGDLRERVAALARKLQAEGLMDAARKRPVPPLPQRIGVVTSPHGAAVHDVLRTLRRRWPLADVALAGVPVEGAGAPAALIEGLQRVAFAEVDVVLLVRGGGSFEDLMPFNDEGLARAIAAMPMPVVTGIGHEPDNSIADMVADLRASTPTAAAEAVSPDMGALRTALDDRAGAMGRALSRQIREQRLRLERLSTRPCFTEREALLGQHAQALDIAVQRLARAIPGNLARDAAALGQMRARLASCGKTLVEPCRSRLVLAGSRLNDLSPLAVISRGYAIARTKEGRVVRTVEQAPAGSAIDVTVSDGTLSCLVQAGTPRGTE